MRSLAIDFIIENSYDSSNSSSTVTPINMQLSDSFTGSQDTCNDESSCSDFSASNCSVNRSSSSFNSDKSLKTKNKKKAKKTEMKLKLLVLVSQNV